MSAPRAMTPKDGCAWITGASTGIGRAVALRLARDGWTVVASARSADKLEALAAEAEALTGRIVPKPVDVTDKAALTDAVSAIEAEVGPIALSILNAGTFVPDGVKGFEAETFAKQFTLNVFGVANCLEPLLPVLIARGTGQVAIVSSVAGYRGLPRALGYGASKAALINFAESLYLQARPYGIKVQVVNPGFVRTPLTDKNDFPMPFLVEVEDAADRIVRGLGRDGFEIAFPTPFVAILKRLRCLPYALYFPLVGRTTGAGRGDS